MICTSVPQGGWDVDFDDYKLFVLRLLCLSLIKDDIMVVMVGRCAGGGGVSV